MVSSTAHVLPFDRLSPADFERLCLWLVRREGYEDAEHLGAAGSEQGRDVVARKDGRRVVFQCKNTRTFYPADAADEIEKILSLGEEQRPEEVVFVVACKVSARTREEAQAQLGTIACGFWAETELDERVKRHQELLDEFFQKFRVGLDVPFVVAEEVPHFTGREAELARLADLLLRREGERVCGIVGVAGAGGIGKTALAAELARRHRADFPDGVLTAWVGDKPPGQVVKEMARDCGLRVDPEDTREAPAIAQELFRHRRMLLILDNAVDATVRELLPGGDRCAVVVTTRDRGVAAVLGLDDDATLDVPVLPDDDAVLLLRRWLGDARIDAEPGAAAEIGGLVGHLPLALRIVGATLHIQDWRRLDDYAAALAEERTRLARLSTAELDVRASFELSLRSLSENDVDALACLSVCADDGFSVRGARAAIGCAEVVVHERLGTLRQGSLLNASAEDGGWFTFHPLLRLFASELAEERGLREEAEERHALFFVEEVKATAAADHAAEAVLAREIGDVLVAARWLRRQERGDYDFVIRLRSVLESYGLWKQAVEVLSDFLELVANTLNLEGSASLSTSFRERFLQDLETLLARLYALSDDFFRPGTKGRGKELVPEATFSAVLSMGFQNLGWRVEREAQYGRRTDLKLGRAETEDLALVEVRIWGRNDFRRVQQQLASYWSYRVAAGAVVMLTDREIPDGAERYRSVCLDPNEIQASLVDTSGLPIQVRFSTQSTLDDGSSAQIDHFLVPLRRPRSRA